MPKKKKVKKTKKIKKLKTSKKTRDLKKVKKPIKLTEKKNTTPGPDEKPEIKKNKKTSYRKTNL